MFFDRISGAKISAVERGFGPQWIKPKTHFFV